MARLRSLVPLLVLCLVAALAPPASARTVLGDLPDEVADVDAHAVAPNLLAYGFEGDYEEPYGVFVQGGDGRPRRQRQFDSLRSLRSRERGADEYARTVAVGASDHLVAVGVSSRASYYDANDEFHIPGPAAVAVARPGGRAVRIATCRAGRFFTVRVDDRTVAYLGGCDPRRLDIGVRDMRTGASRTIRAPGGSSFWDVKVAGRYVAGAIEGTRGGVAVYDWRSGRELYRVDLFEFSLARDGKLAGAGGAEQGGCLASDARWFSPAEPRPHVLPGAGCEDDVLIAGGRILGSRFVESVPNQGTVAEYFVTDLRDRRRTPLFVSETGPGFVRYPVYFDGRRVGYSGPRCDSGARIVVDTVEELARGPLPPETCRVSLRQVPSELRLARRSPSALLSFPCTLGCSARVRLWDLAEGRYLQLHDRDYTTFYAPRRGTGQAEIDLAADDHARLTRDGRLELELRVEILQPAGANTTRTRPLTLLPPA